MKEIFGPKFKPKEPKSCLELFFCYFFKFGSLVFLEIEYSDSLEQCVTSTKGKTYKKDFGTKLWPKRTKIRPKISFFAIFSSLVH